MYEWDSPFLTKDKHCLQIPISRKLCCVFGLPFMQAIHHRLKTRMLLRSNPCRPHSYLTYPLNPLSSKGQRQVGTKSNHHTVWNNLGMIKYPNFAESKCNIFRLPSNSYPWKKKKKQHENRIQTEYTGVHELFISYTKCSSTPKVLSLHPHQQEMERTSFLPAWDTRAGKLKMYISIFQFLKTTGCGETLRLQK